MIDFMGYLIGVVWQLLSIPIKIDNITLRLWYFPIFVYIITVVWRFIFGGGTDDK